MATNTIFSVPATQAPNPVRFRTLTKYLSFSAIRIIAALAAVDIVVWVGVAIVLHWHPALTSTAVLSYTFGLRHALDADHISVIDLMTRRLIASGSKPVTVGMWFSLGHSTVVVVTCIVVAATSGALETRFDGFERVGNIVGTSVSAAVLILLGLFNAWILVKLVQKLRRVLNEEVGEDAVTGFAGDGAGLKLEGGGVLAKLMWRVFQLVDRPWKMYFVGVLFGLGFDTSSEVAIIGIASIEGAEGTSFWLILIFPILFTAGMCLIDTIDGALMMTLYTSTSLARDTVAILYYSIVLTAITVLVAICIGTIQVLSLIAGVANPSGPFWDGVDTVGDDFDIIGGSICGLFVVCGIASVIIYRPWRRWVDRNRNIARIERTELRVQNIGRKSLDDKRFGTTGEIVQEAELECPA